MKQTKAVWVGRSGKYTVTGYCEPANRDVGREGNVEIDTIQCDTDGPEIDAETLAEREGVRECTVIHDLEDALLLQAGDDYAASMQRNAAA